MKVLLLSSTYMSGGAGRAAGRLHQALTGMDVDAHMLVHSNSGEAGPSIHGPAGLIEKASVFLKPTLEALPLLLYPDRNRLIFSANFLPDRIATKASAIAPDVINLHWVNNGLLRIETLPKLAAPLVWTLHDSWAFTGGCHIPLDCRRYTASCGRCPALGSNSEHDLSRWTWRRKAKAWRGVPITVVTPSHWLARCAKDSALFEELRIEVIPNGLDLNRIVAVDKKLARDAFGLADGKKYILFGAHDSTIDRNKGFQYLAAALKKLAEAGLGETCEVVVFGSDTPHSPPDLGLRTRYLGYFHDEQRLNQLYAAADLFVAPSMQENLPFTIMEAMASGTPCVAFDVGGIPELVDHKVNGFLAKPFQTESLAEGMAWVLKGEVDAYTLSRACRDKVETEFDIKRCAEKYLKLYQELARPPGPGR
ncbi:MAG TPA: glycosyl transferase [Geobacter sp.]|nr:glycosyl transferase [Geobacter sp.]